MSLAFSPEGPYPLIPINDTNFDFHNSNTLAQWFSTELILMHNVVIRGLNSIWLNAPLVLRSDTKSFIGYGLACTSLIRAHHKTQEQVIFPRFQEKIDMRMNVVQHLTFETQLKNLEAYLQNVLEGNESYDCERLLGLRAALGGTLVQHLHDEVRVLQSPFFSKAEINEREVSTVSQMQLSAFSVEELNIIAHAIDDHKKDLRDSPTFFPFIMTHHHKEDAPNWPVLPASVKWLINHVGLHLHHDYWKFSPYTATGDFRVYPPRST
ncbi:hypothetical protein CPB84DRAFT_1846226 [Gymnopilus junonius]|uniref:Hemerythrin-like domain-containing protein n=1 Tax=Gymnopilus junonius TaxID=109634 RepID=A0A9P5NR50_GYMJU|nr:hypothetical protein CPB84DRAFT_1846226 [Gymnopilus junonius]